jgi:diacylglycerol kinase (ATP)
LTGSPYKDKTGLRRAIRATGYSISGIAAAARHEPAFRELLALCAVLAPAAFWLGDTPLERALLIGSLMLALVVELVNAAIEATVDRVSYERHPLAKRAKDMGSAAVMLSLVNAALVWLLILLR